MAKDVNRGIQVLRGVLCIMIMIFHSAAGFASIFWGGVIGFFVLSSYFLTRKVMRNDVLSFEEQVKYRLKRLYPAYLVLIVIAFLASLWRRLVPWDIVIYIAFFQNITWRFPVGEMSMAQMMAHTWTLCIEVWMGSVWLFLLMRIRREYWKEFQKKEWAGQEGEA